MKFKKLLNIISIIVVFTILFITLYTPTGAIRIHLFLFNPIQSLTCTVEKTDIIDSFYGQQYWISGCKPWDGTDDTHFAYIKRNSFGCYYWSGGGSGP